MNVVQQEQRSTRKMLRWSTRLRRFTLMFCAVLCCLLGCSSAPALPYVIAGGAESGVYYTYGEQLATQAERELGVQITVAHTQGSVDNLLRVGSGEALLGFTQGDTAADALAGVGAFTESIPVTAVARLYDEYVHVVVPAASDAMQIADLAGRKVSLGAADSGVQVIAQRVLAASGVAPEDVAGSPLGLEASLAALRTGEIEAFFWVGGLPTPGIERLSEDLPLRLLPLTPAMVERVNDDHLGVYRTAEFPANSYNTGENVPTMMVPNYLIAHADTSPALIRDITRVLFGWNATIADEVRAAAFLDRRQAIFTEPVPLHEGAAEYYVRTRS